MSKSRWNQLNRQVESCGKCRRLRRHCEQVAVKKRKSYQEQNYWGKPVRNFGKPGSKLLVIGLAPGAHGANRTGRMFTGDRSGDWLYRALYRAGFANQPTSTHRRDGLKLIDCVVTNICRCAPPDNKPDRIELDTCQPFLEETISLCHPKVIIALGGMAWKTMVRILKSKDELAGSVPKFSHGAKTQTSAGLWLLGSYHPSQQNTFTGRLTEPMLDEVFSLARRVCNDKVRQDA